MSYGRVIEIREGIGRWTAKVNLVRKVRLDNSCADSLRNVVHIEDVKLHLDDRNCDPSAVAESLRAASQTFMKAAQRVEDMAEEDIVMGDTVVSEVS